MSNSQLSKFSSTQACPDDKYWVRPHQRIKKDKNGKTHIEKVKGYCSSYRAPYHKIALEEKISLDHLFMQDYSAQAKMALLTKLLGKNR